MPFKSVFKDGGYRLVSKDQPTPIRVVETHRRVYAIHNDIAWFKTRDTVRKPWKTTTRVDALTILGDSKVPKTEKTIEQLSDEDQQFLWEHLLKQ